MHRNIGSLPQIEQGTLCKGRLKFTKFAKLCNIYKAEGEVLYSDGHVLPPLLPLLSQKHWRQNYIYHMTRNEKKSRMRAARVK